MRPTMLSLSTLSLYELRCSFVKLRSATHTRPLLRQLHVKRLLKRPLCARPSTPYHGHLSRSPIRSLTDSVAPQAKKSSLIWRFFAKSFFYAGIFGAGTVILVAGFFAYDASTYKEASAVEAIPVSTLALNPRRGGPKNLPLVEHFVDDDDCEGKKTAKHKPKLVILGTGWASVALLKTLQPQDWHVTVISPSNQFLFTPMLPSAAAGTLELRSLVEPVRNIISTVNGHFLQSMAVGVAFSEKLVEVESVDNNTGITQSYYVPYDKLVIATGSISNPHGVPGLQYCHFLKDIHDARAIRNSIIRNLEQASLPVTSEEERKRLLSFVVCGGGPTGVEVISEICAINEDMRGFPKLLRCQMSFHLVQSRGHILNTYDEALSKFAEQRFDHDHINLYTNARVKEVTPDKVIFTQMDAEGKIITKEVPMGFCLWSTGVSQTELAQSVAANLPEQTNKHALETDSHCRLIGAPLGDVYAVGDCATVQNNVSDHIVSFLRTLAWEKGRDPTTMAINYADWRKVAKRVRSRFPQAASHLRKADKLFSQYDRDSSGTLDFGELTDLLKQIDRKLTSLPATAQRAHQQGEYLAKKFNKMAQAAPGLRLNEVEYGDLDEIVYQAFEYRHLGSLANIGNSAVFDVSGTGLDVTGWKGFAGNIIAVYLWRSVYFLQSVSFRTRFLLAMDWTKRALFGRDMMNVP